MEPNFAGKEGNIDTLIEVSKTLCNRAHNLQNLICAYQGKEATKAEANIVNGAAGNIENQFRAILNGIDANQEVGNIENIKKIVIN